MKKLFLLFIVLSIVGCASNPSSITDAKKACEAGSIAMYKERGEGYQIAFACQPNQF